MKIAIPFHNGFVNDHFGHTENYTVFTVNSENKIVDRKIIKAELGCGYKSGIGELLAREGVTIMLAGNIGSGAIQHLYTEGIEVIRGCSGPAEEVVVNYVNGLIIDGGQTCNQHAGCHEHHH